MTDESVGLTVHGVDSTILEYFLFVFIYIVFDDFKITITIYSSCCLTMEIEMQIVHAI